MKLSNSNRKKWIKAYYKDFKQYALAPILAIAFITFLCIQLSYVERKKSQQQIELLESEKQLLQSEVLELLEMTTSMGDEINDLTYENQIFASMLAEIENEPGGHEILTKLYQERK